MSNALTTKARVKDRLKISGTTFDDLLDRLILSVTARMETMCGRQFTLATYTNEVHDGSDFSGSVRRILITKNAPVASVSSIEWNAGTQATPNWQTFDADTYSVDYSAGLVYFDIPLPRGQRNIRTTYTAGWDGFSIGIANVWTFNITPSGDVDGSNRDFTLPENADQVIVYADGVRLASSNVTFTAGTDEFTIASGSQPFSTIAADYAVTASEESGDPYLPEELVDVCERAVVFLFKKREAEGKTNETLEESSITWRENIFTAEMRATIKNYRRGYNL